MKVEQHITYLWLDNKTLRHRLTYHPTIQYCFRAPVLNLPNVVTLTTVLHNLLTPTTNLFLWLLHNYEFAAVMNPIVNHLLCRISGMWPLWTGHSIPQRDHCLQVENIGFRGYSCLEKLYYKTASCSVARTAAPTSHIHQICHTKWQTYTMYTNGSPLWDVHTTKTCFMSRFAEHNLVVKSTQPHNYCALHLQGKLIK